MNNIKELYENMPIWEPDDISKCFKKIEIEFDDIEYIKNKTDLEITNKTKSIFYPKKKRRSYKDKKIISNIEEFKNPRYPIYIISKSRYEKRLTSDSLIKMKVKHYIVVEKEQIEEYKKRVDKNFVEILELPKEYLENYDTFDNLGNEKSKGPGAARNFAWEHSLKNGFKRHWVMDDNSEAFYIMHGNQRIPVNDGSVLRIMEEHTDRFENVLISGPHYRFFRVPCKNLSPLILNSRIYSCLLIKNDIDYRWRGRYNEDTDLSLRVLKDGFCTIQYSQFLFGKIGTQKMSGGNTEAFYKQEGTYLKSKMLYDMHPDVTKLIKKYNRDHHYVDYSSYKNNILKYNKDYVKTNKINNYGLNIEDFNE